jgi:parvulin-like peptidyl-prolyl isomerase
MRTALAHRSVRLAMIGALVIGASGIGLGLVGCSKERTADTAKSGTQTAKADTAQAPTVPKFVQPLPPNTIRASHILISYKGTPVTEATRSQAEAKQLAEQLLARVKAGEDFAKLAETYSDCPSAEDGGDLGPFPKGRMVPPFDQAAFALRPGQISGIVETQFGYHIIKRTQ